MHDPPLKNQADGIKRKNSPAPELDKCLARRSTLIRVYNKPECQRDKNVSASQHAARFA